jgi:hypothetical protein
MATLTAAPNPVLVDAKKGQKSQATAITYVKDSSDVIWFGIMNAGGISPWIRRPADPSATLALSGTFTSPQLRPGDIFRVRILPANQDPNDPGVESRRSQADVDVFSLLKNPGLVTTPFGSFEFKRASMLKPDSHDDVGGTFYWVRLLTNVPTFMHMTITRRPPTLDANGMPFAPDPTNEIIGTALAAPMLTQDG